MATEPKPSHTRADSATDGTDTTSKTFATAQNFCTAVSSFTSQNGVQALTELLQLLPQRENEIKIKEDTIRDLKAKSAAQAESHSAYTRKQLSDFEDRYDEWAEEVTTLQSEVEDLKLLSKKKDTEMHAIREMLAVSKARNGELENEHTHVTKRFKEQNHQLIELEARLQKTQSDAEACTQELKKSHEQITVLKRSSEDEVKKYQSLKDEATRTKERLQTLVQFSVKIKELDLPGTINRVETLWRSAINIVRHFIGQELSDDILADDWTKLRGNSVFKNRIPLPQSNSAIAKEMRVALILGTLAKLIDDIVFQPTFLFHEDSGLREILRHQAVIDPNKERYARGILLSMFPEDQETSSNEGVGIVVEDLLNTANVRVLLTPETISTFEKELRSLVTKFQEEWKVIQRGKQKLEPSFNYSASADLPWHVLDLQVTEAKEGKQKEAQLLTGKLDDNFVIVPRLYLIGTEPEPTPVTHGCVLRKAHLDAAEDEVRKGLPSAPFARAPSSRHRSRPVRGMSVTSDADRSGRNGNLFLSQAREASDM